MSSLLNLTPFFILLHSVLILDFFYTGNKQWLLVLMIGFEGKRLKIMLAVVVKTKPLQQNQPTFLILWAVPEQIE